MNNRANECRGKRQYETQANAIAASVALKKRTGGDKANAYFCTECGKFHIGRKGSKNGKKEHNMFELLKPKAKVLEPVSVSKLSWVAERVRRSQSGVFSELATITPDIARHLLEYNEDNRNVQKALVDQIASDIKNNLWQVNGEAIIVAKDGQLNDGQHRLNAIIEAGIPVKTIIIFGVDRESRMTVDMGSARTTGDFLGMNSIKNSNVAASIAKSHYHYRRGRYYLNSNIDTPSKQMILSEYYAYKKEIDRAADIVAGKKFLRRLGSSTIGFAFLLIHRANPICCDHFFNALETGEELKRGSPILVLRNLLIDASDKSTSQKLTPREKLEAILRYYNAWIDGKSIQKRLPIRGEYPKISG